MSTSSVSIGEEEEDNQLKIYPVNPSATNSLYKQILTHLKNLVVEIIENKELLPENKKDIRPDIFLGRAGIAYMFWKLANAQRTCPFFPQAMQHAWDHINIAMGESDHWKTRQLPTFAFLRGSAGVNALGGVIANSLGLHKEAAHALKQFRTGISCCMAFMGHGTDYDALPAGRAGFLLGSYWLNSVLSSTPPVSDYELVSIGQLISLSGRAYAANHRLDIPLMFEYNKLRLLGAGTGISAILLALLENPCYGSADTDTRCAEWSDIRSTIDFLVSMQRADGSFPTCLEALQRERSGGKPEQPSVNWCHGTAGISYLLAKAFLTYGDAKYLDALRKASDHIWLNGVESKGICLCRGLAGNGYHFLLMYRLTRDAKYLQQALRFAELLVGGESAQKAKVLYREQSPTNSTGEPSEVPGGQMGMPSGTVNELDTGTEHKIEMEEKNVKTDIPVPYRYRYSLFGGSAGVVCFLLDMLDPDNAQFPFMNIFD